MVALAIWFGISFACIYYSAWLVTKQKPYDLYGIAVMALMIPFIEAMRYWPLLFVINRSLVIWLRVGAGVISMLALYLFAHLRLGLDKEGPKWLFATMYPGIKLILFFLIKDLPKN